MHPVACGESALWGGAGRHGDCGITWPWIRSSPTSGQFLCSLSLRFRANKAGLVRIVSVWLIEVQMALTLRSH